MRVTIDTECLQPDEEAIALAIGILTVARSASGPVFKATYRDICEIFGVSATDELMHKLWVRAFDRAIAGGWRTDNPARELIQEGRQLSALGVN